MDYGPIDSDTSQLDQQQRCQDKKSQPASKWLNSCQQETIQTLSTTVYHQLVDPYSQIPITFMLRVKL